MSANGEPAEPTGDLKSENVEDAIERLQTALADYDKAKSEHAVTTTVLTDAKKEVDTRARAVVEAKHRHRQPMLGDVG